MTLKYLSRRQGPDRFPEISRAASVQIWGSPSLISRKVSKPTLLILCSAISFLARALCIGVNTNTRCGSRLMMNLIAPLQTLQMPSKIMTCRLSIANSRPTGPCVPCRSYHDNGLLELAIAIFPFTSRGNSPCGVPVLDNFSIFKNAHNIYSGRCFG